MSETPETPQQRQLRLRQQKREAKLQAQGQERLEKITNASGRVVSDTIKERPITPIPSGQSPLSTIVADDPAVQLPSTAMFGQTNDPDQQQMQREYMRALLGGAPQGQIGQPQQSGMPAMDENDPMVKILQTVVGSMAGDPNAAAGEMPSFSADDISKMTGIPSFLTSMFMPGQKVPPTPAEIKTERTWKILRILMSVLIGVYTIFVLDRSLTTFGVNPPAPATAQNPFVVFLMGELLVNGSKSVVTRTSKPAGIKSIYQAGKSIARDGAVVLFAMGLYSWWNGFVGYP